MNNILTIEQSGFHPNRSVVSALLKLTKDVYFSKQLIIFVLVLVLFLCWQTVVRAPREGSEGFQNDWKDNPLSAEVQKVTSYALVVLMKTSRMHFLNVFPANPSSYPPLSTAGLEESCWGATARTA